MLGSPCSPCCGGGCSAETLHAIYDALCARSCVVSFAGTLPRQDAATVLTPSVVCSINANCPENFESAFLAAYENYLRNNAAGTFFKSQAFPTSVSLALDLSQSSFVSSPANGTITFVGSANGGAEAYRCQLRLVPGSSVVGDPTYVTIPGTQCVIQISVSATWHGVVDLATYSTFNISQPVVTQVDSCTWWGEAHIVAPYYQTGIFTDSEYVGGNAAMWDADIRTSGVQYPYQRPGVATVAGDAFSLSSYTGSAFTATAGTTSISHIGTKPRVWLPYSAGVSPPRVSSAITPTGIGGSPPKCTFSYTAATQEYAPDPQTYSVSAIQVSLS